MRSRQPGEFGKVSSGMDVLREQQHQKTVSVVIVSLATHPIETVLLKLRYMRHDGTFAAYGVRVFGPLEHMHCDDLLSGTNGKGPIVARGVATWSRPSKVAGMV